MADETPQEIFDKYKKELGKQYMDGLISDVEYDEMLKAKEAELGLNQPVIVDEDEGPECPSCGALISEYDAECSICGIALEPVSPPEIPDAELGIDGPDLDEVGMTCANCGAEISEVDTVCTMCGNILGSESEPVEEAVAVEAEITDIIDEQPMADEASCPSCGAFVDADATECIICDTPLGGALPEPEIPVEAEISEEVPATIEEVPAEEELICGGCGAVLDEGATECFICGETFGKVPAIEEPVESVPEPIEIDEPEEAIDEPEPLPEPIEEPDDDLPEIAEPIEGQEPLDIPEEDDLVEELPSEDDIEELPLEDMEELSAEDTPSDDMDDIPEAELVEEIILNEGEIICPSCSSVIPEESDKCPECWTDFSLYVRCPACSLLTPSGEDSCRECFAPIEVPEMEEEIPESQYIPGDMDLSHLDVEIPDEEIIITEELKEEMSHLEVEEEQGKECLVCGAIFGPEDEVCPICFMEYGTELEEPEKIDYDSWDTMEVAVAPTKYICPNCGENITGMDATDREINEGRWFYRGIISIFIGIFFTSFSIWARGVSAENASLGLNPPPTDVLLNVLGWIMVLLGFVFWFFSWKLHEERVECINCGIEINPDMANCINCGVDLTEGEQYEEDYPEEEYYEESVPVEEIFEEEPLEVPEEFDEPIEEAYEEPVEDLEVPEETFEGPEEEIPESEPTIEPEEPGFELPTGHEEHKQCPGCGIFVDLGDSICPVCDTEFEAVEIVEPEAVETVEPETVADEEIEIMSEEDELAGLAVEAEPDIDDATVPEEGTDHVECPSCGADVDKGLAACPVCEYPLDG